MKKALFALLLLALPSAFADTEIVPLEINPGYWESNSELIFSKQMEDMLASIPEAQRGALTAMVKSKSVIPMTKSCITEESYKDFGKKIEESLGEQQEGCEMNLKESTGKSFVGEYQCEGVTATFAIEVESAKRHVTNVETIADGTVQSQIKVVADWKGSDCPADAIH